MRGVGEPPARTFFAAQAGVAVEPGIAMRGGDGFVGTGLAGGFPSEMIVVMPMGRKTRLNGFLMDCELAQMILCAVTCHEPGKSALAGNPVPVELAGEIERLVRSGHTETASRELVNCLKRTPEAMVYLAGRLFEAK